MKTTKTDALSALKLLLKDWKEDPGFSDLDGEQPVCLWTTKKAIREAQFAAFLLDQAHNGPWDGSEQERYIAIANDKARAAIAKATKS